MKSDLSRIKIWISKDHMTKINSIWNDDEPRVKRKKKILVKFEVIDSRRNL